MARAVKKNISFDEAMKKIEEIVSLLEGGDVPLEESIELYKKAMELSDICKAKLIAADGEITILRKKADGFFEEPFEESFED